MRFENYSPVAQKKKKLLVLKLCELSLWLQLEYKVKMHICYWAKNTVFFFKVTNVIFMISATIA